MASFWASTAQPRTSRGARGSSSRARPYIKKLAGQAQDPGHRPAPGSRQPPQPPQQQFDEFFPQPGAEKGIKPFQGFQGRHFHLRAFEQMT